jgi:hypothetical protein
MEVSVQLLSAGIIPDQIVCIKTQFLDSSVMRKRAEVKGSGEHLTHSSTEFTKPLLSVKHALPSMSFRSRWLRGEVVG